MASGVISLNTVEEWEEQFKKANESKKLVVVDFTATWCGPCKIMAPVLDEVARKHPQVICFKVDVDKLKTVAQEWFVEAMPTFVLLKEGKVVERFVGAEKDRLALAVTKHLPSEE